MHPALRSGLAALVLLMPLPTLAGPVTAFETNVRQAYADYRSALFMTNMGKAEKSLAAIEAFAAKWQAISAQPAPPHYADDAGYADTMAKVAEIARQARGEIAAGKLPAAHDTLEAIREEIGSLHRRNGIEAFSDRMNAYHAQMEKVLKGAGSMPMEAMHEEAAILVFLAADLQPRADDGAGTPAFDTLHAALVKSADDLLAAIRSGDKGAVKAAIGALKPAYSKMFLKFG